MNDITPDCKCPCESGFLFSECCGVENRRAVNADITAVITTDGTTVKQGLTPQLKSAIASIADNPDLFPARIDFANNKAWFVKMSPRWYRESVFLDPGRIKGTVVIEADLVWLQQTCNKLTWQPTSFIFHTAFCGSTLMSQALDALFQSLPLREPEVLGNVLVYQRSNADSEDKTVWCDYILRLLSRRNESQQPVVVKANDYANPMMIELTNIDHQIPMLFMYTPLKEFLAGCLKAENRREWIAQRYKSAISIASQWLNLPKDVSIKEDDYGKMAAVYWCYNIALYIDVVNRSPSLVRSLDFNQMLANPLEAVEATGALFGLDWRDNVDGLKDIDRLLGVYSKNSKFKYSPDQRNNDISTLLKQYPIELEEAEQLAHQLLGNHYPSQGLSACLLGTKSLD